MINFDMYLCRFRWVKLFTIIDKEYRLSQGDNLYFVGIFFQVFSLRGSSTFYIANEIVLRNIRIFACIFICKFLMFFNVQIRFLTRTCS